MGISLRAYIFAEDGDLKRVPQRVYDALVAGEDAIAEFAGTRQRVANVLVENDDQRPVRILDVRGVYWTFDPIGRIDAGLQASASEMLGISDWFSGHRQGKERARVVDLVPEIKKRDVRSRHRWDLKAEEIERIAADLWPSIHGAAKDVALVKGKKPVRPPLPAQARAALGEIGSLLSKIDWEIQKLSEASLKGLAFEARRTGTGEDMPDLWNGLGAACDRMRNLRIQQRTGKGVWYALIEICHWEDPARHSSRVHVVTYERCADRKTAVLAARRLLKENADRFEDNVSVEASIRSELEWQPDDMSDSGLAI